MNKLKFKYKKYDYSFLFTKKDNLWTRALSMVSKMIGLNTATTQPINQPSGVFYYINFQHQPVYSKTILNNPNNTYTTSAYNYTTTYTSAGPQPPVVLTNSNDFYNFYNYSN